MNFPDHQHLKHLQKDLWQWPKSRAAVMVGAGLSRNSEPLPGVAKGFPTWRELVRAMCDELEPAWREASPEQAKAREVRFNNSDPLRVASEYEAAFGPQKLEQLIREQTPDADHQPGTVHRLLLQLPWADVFTTNYDTLLERTEIPGRTYSPVMKASELTHASSPRIVKLHGSFPAQTPFISTEEHYRTYPRNFAPFVNTVRQSLLENSFVLVGFSGDDPNFLEWTGWIRDELGGNHAPIYLVGPLSLSSAQRSLLERRGVTPIDLAPLFEGARPRELHYASIIWFLRTLLGAREPRPEDWPVLSRRTLPAVEGVPLIPSSSVYVPAAVEIGPKGKLTEASVAAVIDRWRYEREAYPGWVVAPQQKRSDLWQKTRPWYGALIDFAKTWSAADRILLFREIDWRLETAMSPYFPELIEPFDSAVNELFDALAQGLEIGTPKNPTFQSRTAEVADAWSEIALGLVRDAREDYDEGRSNDLRTKLARVLLRHPKYGDRAHYEEALWAVWNVERPQAKKALARWQPSPSSPLASIRKAGLLAELDELGESIIILRSALLEIRRGLRNQGRNIGLLSLEGWCTYLIFYVESALDLSRHPAVREEFGERWQELRAWDCDPWSHNEYFEEILSTGPPPPPVSREEIRGFDPGRVTVTHHLAGEDYLGSLLPGFACIRLYEQAGLPLRLRGVKIADETLGLACQWVAPFVKFWSPALLIRAGKVDDLIKGPALTRTAAAAMEPGLVKRLFNWCLPILNRELAYAHGTRALSSARESLLPVLSEVLSRLSFRADTPQLKASFELSLQLHLACGPRRNGTLNESCDNWFERLFATASEDLLLEWLPQLAKAPLFAEGVEPGVPPELLPADPMRHFPSKKNRLERKLCGEFAAKVEDATDWLLRRGASESGEGWRRVVERLIVIYRAGLMTAGQQRQMGELVWAQRNAASLPDRRSAAPFELLHLPTASGVDVISAVKGYILSLPSTGAVDRGANGEVNFKFGGEQLLILEASISSKPIVHFRDEALGLVEWTREEAGQLYHKAREWWANDKEILDPAKSARFMFMGADAAKTTANRLGQFLARIALPRMDWTSDDDWRGLLAWLRDLRDHEVFATVASPYTLLGRPAHADAVAHEIAADISSDLEGTVAASAVAIRHWIGLSSAGLTPTPPPGILMNLIGRVAFRRKSGIKPCVLQLAYLIAERQEAISHWQAELLADSLEPWHDATAQTAPSAGEFDEAQRPHLRALVAHLAGALELWYSVRLPETPMPLSITRWRARCEADPLPEVRCAFDVWRDKANQ